MASWISIAQLVLLGLVVVLLLWLALRRGDADATDRLERNLRADVQDSARGTRSELAQSLATFQQTLLAQASDVARSLFRDTSARTMRRPGTALASIRRTVSTPCLWPATRGRKRFFAQRPLPSMMIAR